jgi:hypothetical protein
MRRSQAGLAVVRKAIGVGRMQQHSKLKHSSRNLPLTCSTENILDVL